jgi:hypothetical protein
MQITRNTLETAVGPEDWFTGTVYIDRVYFEPGEDHWHGAAPDRFMVRCDAGSG